MTPASRAWLDGLLAMVAATRQERVGTDRDRAAAEAEAERGILARHLTDWLGRIDAVSAARRAFAGDDASLDPDPALVFTTSPVGIRLLADLLGRDDPGRRSVADRLACATEAEYRRHCMHSPDEGHRLHVNHWSWVKTSVPRQRWGDFSRHPLAAGESYWLHRTGTAGAGAADGRRCDLWRFDGRVATLLEADVAERGV
jgi:hypothetical protein